jgi:hypothetical protein
MMIDAATVEFFKFLSSAALLASASYAAFFLGRSYVRLWAAKTSRDPHTLRRTALNDRKLSTLLPLKIFILTALGLILGIGSLFLEFIDFFCPNFIQ